MALAFGLTALILWGGYGRHWSWTGINGQTATLWDWLHLLLLPLAVAFLPIWMRSDARLQSRVKFGAIAGLSVLALIVVFGYLIPWNWTGFRGNKLWDWLNLVALPVAVALAPLLPELRTRWRAHHSTMAGAGAVIFVVVVAAGYMVPWAWTGFTGNTLWDWLHLLLLPLLVPTLLVPALQPVAEAPMVPLAREESRERPDAVETPVERPAAVEPQAPAERPTSVERPDAVEPQVPVERPTSVEHPGRAPEG